MIYLHSVGILFVSCLLFHIVLMSFFQLKHGQASMEPGLDKREKWSLDSLLNALLIFMYITIGCPIERWPLRYVYDRCVLLQFSWLIWKSSNCLCANLPYLVSELTNKCIYMHMIGPDCSLSGWVVRNIPSWRGTCLNHALSMTFSTNELIPVFVVVQIDCASLVGTRYFGA